MLIRSKKTTISALRQGPNQPTVPLYTRSKSEVLPYRKRLSLIRPRIKSSASRPEFTQIPENALTERQEVGNMMSDGDGGVIQDVGWDTNKGDKVAVPSGKGLLWNCCFAGVLGWNSIFTVTLGAGVWNSRFAFNSTWTGTSIWARNISTLERYLCWKDICAGILSL